MRPPFCCGHPYLESTTILSDYANSYAHFSNLSLSQAFSFTVFPIKEKKRESANIVNITWATNNKWTNKNINNLHMYTHTYTHSVCA